jgi:hypothetical protein
MQTLIHPPLAAVRLCWKAPDRSQHLADGASYRCLTVAPSLLIKNNTPVHAATLKTLRGYTDTPVEIGR